MSQVKIYGLREQLKPIRSRLSNTIHSCVVEALSFPADKRAHRFFHLDPDDFFAPSGRTDRYTIIERKAGRNPPLSSVGSSLSRL
jgi:hypothetical protein